MVEAKKLPERYFKRRVLRADFQKFPSSIFSPILAQGYKG